MSNEHTEQDPRIESFIKTATTLLTYKIADDVVVTALENKGALNYEAFFAIQAAKILMKDD